MCGIHEEDKGVFVRPAEEGDIAFLAELGGKEFPYIGDARSFFSKRLNNIWILVVGGERIGFVDVEGCWLEGIAVSPRHRGRGWGRFLLRYVLFLLRERGCKRVYLRTVPLREEARKLYASEGFRIERYEHPFEVWVKEL